MLGDSVTKSSTPVIAQLIDAFSRLQGAVIGVETVQTDVVHRYGIVAAEEIEQGLLAVHDLIEKPGVGSAPSRIAVAGRYVLPEDIFTVLEKTDPGIGGELQLTDAIRQLLTQQPVYALMYQGKRFDIGNKLDYVRANMEFALGDKEISNDVNALLHSLSEPS
jgi:UTP--glucose-1-phosphate uridylyltransferase